MLSAMWALPKLTPVTHPASKGLLITVLLVKVILTLVLPMWRIVNAFQNGISEHSFIQPHSKSEHSAFARKGRWLQGWEVPEKHCLHPGDRAAGRAQEIRVRGLFRGNWRQLKPVWVSCDCR